jgi:hypothetical protein
MVDERDSRDRPGDLTRGRLSPLGASRQKSAYESTLGGTA